ncbi:MAG: class I SAM-dependent methyltransferase [Vulcanimicrobiaceae bacterium]
MNDAFSAFGEAAAHRLPPIMVSGRLPVFSTIIDETVEDVSAKLRPEKTDRLLEIGCGLGLLLRPLASMVHEAVGIDHPSLVEEFSSQQPPDNVLLLPGRFPDVRPSGSFDAILVYSVMHYLPSAEAAGAFIDGCLEVLAPGGRLLLADLPNHDAWQRYHASSEGQGHLEAIEARKQAMREQYPEEYKIYAKFTATRFIDDAFVLSVLTDLRGRGYETYILPQHPAMPNCKTREDILIQRRA